MDTQEKIYTSADSKSGMNAHLHWCDYTDQRRYFGTCAHLIDAFNKGELGEGSVHGDCSHAMQRGNCPGLAMRAEELKAGKAIYFIPRTGNPDKPGKPKDEAAGRYNPRSAGYQAGWNRVSATSGAERTQAPVSSTPAPKKPAKPAGPAIQNMDIGAVVTELAKQESSVQKDTSAPTEKKAAHKPEVKAERLPGESMLEMAKRLRAARAQ